ncbi:hypothetical protein FB45DRAFT_1063956 [Roridomyces roridus]|uniref:Uncharacterized protein n=1 Tax=Roridomyces roridus TaxID=1738132 RepID=A0AAD7FF02_9AGAR|nr:hypothetical protein FB45DRAFT_1063956 [Roridomyces roridus]
MPDVPLPPATRTQQKRVEPCLPPELEHTIFVLAAYADPLSVPILILVAWRVKRWVERLRYRVMLFSGGLAGLGGERMPPRVSEELARDPRFVWMMCAQFIQDWHMGALSGVDYWTRAEDFVTRRRAGLLEYALENDESLRLDLP